MAEQGSPPDLQIRFLCCRCERELVGKPDWIGRSVQCPHCSSAMVVPEVRPGGAAVKAKPPGLVAKRHFNFACPQCDSLLEAHTGMSGREGRCPTCGTRFAVPEIDPRRGKPMRAKIIEVGQLDGQAAVHAYGASGAEAPEIVRNEKGTPWIRCPGCRAYSAIDATHCQNCGTPFSMEGAATGGARGRNRLGMAAMIIGLLSVPGFLFILPALLAVILGLVAARSDQGGRRSIPALVAVGLGGLSLLMRVLMGVFQGP